jgi:hypothetical protein
LVTGGACQRRSAATKLSMNLGGCVAKPGSKMLNTA